MERHRVAKYAGLNMQISLLVVFLTAFLLVPSSVVAAMDADQVDLNIDSMNLGNVYLPDLLPVIRTKKSPWKEYIASGTNTSRQVADRLREGTEFDFGDGLETRMANGWISGVAFSELGFELEVIEARTVESRRVRNAATAALKVYLARKGRIQPFSGTISWGLSSASDYQDVIDHLGDPSQWGVAAARQREAAYFPHDAWADDLGRSVASEEDALAAYTSQYQRPQPYLQSLFYERVLGNLNLTFTFSSGGQLQSIEIVPQI